jgi:hypothetical protein
MARYHGNIVAARNSTPKAEATISAVETKKLISSVVITFDMACGF